MPTEQSRISLKLQLTVLQVSWWYVHCRYSSIPAGWNQTVGTVVLHVDVRALLLVQSWFLIKNKNGIHGMADLFHSHLQCLALGAPASVVSMSAMGARSPWTCPAPGVDRCSSSPLVEHDRRHHKHMGPGQPDHRPYIRTPMDKCSGSFPCCDMELAAHSKPNACHHILLSRKCAWFLG